MKDNIVILGAGGFAREVLDIIEAANLVKQSSNVLGFVVDEGHGTPGTIVNDKPILGHFDWLEQHSNEVSVVCGVGASHLRWQLIQRAEAINCRFFNVIHPTAIMTRWLTMGEGNVIAAGCVLTNQITLGNHVHVNLDCTLGHDVILEDYATLAPGVHVSGGVRVEEGSYIGTGVNIIELVRVGRWSIIGAGSTVVRNIPPNVTAVGVPAKVIRERDEDWQLSST